MNHPGSPDPLHATALPAMTRWLECCRRLLVCGERHASQHGRDASALLAARLAPDMFCLAHQVQVLADSLDGACALLTNDASASAAWVFNRGDEIALGDPDLRFDQAIARVDVALQRLRAVTSDTPLLDARAAIVVARPGHARHFVVDDFVWRYVLPNAAFHATLVYALLRAAGVSVGKGDFEGQPVYEVLDGPRDELRLATK